MKKLIIFILPLVLISCEKPTTIDKSPTQRVLEQGKATPAEIQEVLNWQMGTLMLTDGMPVYADRGLYDPQYNLAFQLLLVGNSQYNAVIWPRLKINAGNWNPMIHSMSFILQGSPGVLFATGVPGSEFELSAAFIDFPPYGAGTSSVLVNAVGNRYYFTFFSLNYFSLDWVDKIIAQLSIGTAATGNWITVDRSQAWYYCISQDGYNDYFTVFAPDTLKFD